MKTYKASVLPLSVVVIIIMVMVIYSIGEAIGEDQILLPSRDFTSKLRPTAEFGLNWSPGMWSKYKLKLETDYVKYQTDAKNFEAALEIHDKQFSDCMNKPFTLLEQKNAGCLPSDTWGQCSDKLLKQCMGVKTEELEGAKIQLINDLKAIADDAVKISGMVKTAGKSGN